MKLTADEVSDILGRATSAIEWATEASDASRELRKLADEVELEDRCREYANDNPVCKCGRPSSPGPCPYRVELGYDRSPCNCCSSCRDTCARNT